MQTAQAIQPDNLSGKQSHYSTLSVRQLRRVVDFVGREVGIQLSDSKQILVESRLRKRLRKLDFKSFQAYSTLR